MSGSLTGARNISIGGSLSTSSATSPSSVFKELESRSWMLLLSKITYCVQLWWNVVVDWIGKGFVSNGVGDGSDGFRGSSRKLRQTV